MQEKGRPRNKRVTLTRIRQLIQCQKRKEGRVTVWDPEMLPNSKHMVQRYLS